MSENWNQYYREIVWVKNGNYPWWPSYVYNPNDLNPYEPGFEKAIDLIGKKYYVLFYSDKTMGFCSQNHIKPFNESTINEFKDQKVGKKYETSFKLAIQEAQEDLLKPKDQRLSWYFESLKACTQTQPSQPPAEDSEVIIEIDSHLDQTSKKRGRPSKFKNPSFDSKRSRGRPKKNHSNDDAESENESSSEISVDSNRSDDNDQSQEEDDDEYQEEDEKEDKKEDKKEDEIQEKRKPGRKPGRPKTKEANTTSNPSSVEPKKRGRKPRLSEINDKNESVNDDENEDDVRPNKIRKSFPRKSLTFDETEKEYEKDSKIEKPLESDLERFVRLIKISITTSNNGDFQRCEKTLKKLFAMDMSVSELKQNRDLCRDLLKLKELPNSIISKEVNLIREKWAQIMNQNKPPKEVKLDIEAKTETSKPKSSDFQVKITESNSSNLQLKATENQNLLPSNNITATVASITEECMMNTTVALPNPDLSDQQKTDVASLSTLTASPNKDLPLYRQRSILMLSEILVNQGMVPSEWVYALEQSVCNTYTITKTNNINHQLVIQSPQYFECINYMFMKFKIMEPQHRMPYLQTFWLPDKQNFVLHQVYLS